MKPSLSNNASKQKERLYIAYGSNLNLGQMAQRCPTAEIVGTAFLRNWQLMFRGGNSAVATIERQPGHKVPVLVWRLRERDEAALDVYEGYPHFYRKEKLHITVEGKRVHAMVYIMNEQRHFYGTPSAGYFATIREGYESAGFDTGILRQAVLDSVWKAHLAKKYEKEVSTMTERIKKQIEAIRRSGETNMLDVKTVQRIANREEYFELVVYLEEHRREYANFILTGTEC
ncbi:DUF5049 domain-containing protein [Lachnospiraceae bacterium 56-18]